MVTIVRVGNVTICFKPSLSSIDVMLFSGGCLDKGDRSILKSTRRVRDFEGENCSRAVPVRLVRKVKYI